MKQLPVERAVPLSAQMLFASAQNATLQNSITAAIGFRFQTSLGRG